MVHHKKKTNGHFSLLTSQYLSFPWSISFENSPGVAIQRKNFGAVHSHGEKRGILLREEV
jgi:hypothetical protein